MFLVFGKGSWVGDVKDPACHFCGFCFMDEIVFTMCTQPKAAFSCFSHPAPPYISALHPLALPLCLFHVVSSVQFNVTCQFNLVRVDLYNSKPV